MLVIIVENNKHFFIIINFNGIEGKRLCFYKTKIKNKIK